MPGLTRGPLPARVYWVRRALVLGTAVLLVVAIARMLGGGSDAKGGDDEAELSAGSPSSSAPTVADSGTPAPPTATRTGKGKPGKGRQTSEAPVLAAPTGECVGSDIAVTPKVGNAVAGRDVMIVLQLRTITAEACTWRVAPNALTVNITSGKDPIWSSRQCPRAMPRRDVVVRKAVTTRVGLVWKQAKRSDDTCTVGTTWAYPGWYHVTAAALGGEPSDLQFELKTPTAVTITKTATPTQSPSGKQSPGGKQSPSGAVEP
ncbi:hypothetical protein [Nocardioides sp. YIM 152315]|uniref:hypothetical protein n=1 Tax=Nocardioides sp. YIM 152315 TaxID=3031760 RepID=UPI0023DC911B|nr:hypothetical protein [Nocardioides sp. YIM 152315]MDF1606171.1 hypothetical protein [Nocardioides sp. YIM 152315]